MESGQPTEVDETQVFLDTLWDIHCKSDSWNFITNRLHNGDLFFVLSFMKYFKAIQGPDTKLRFIADSYGKLAILKMFESELDYIGYQEGLSSLRREDVVSWSERTNRSRFAAGSLQRLHPQDIAGGNLQIAPIVYSKGFFTLIEFFKIVLRLPLTNAPVPPVLPDALRQEAHHLFSKYGLQPGRTIIMFPYAQTIAFDARPALEQFAAMATVAGFVVCTATHGKETPISGTKSIQIGFDILIPLAELAGYVVSLRSGIGDMLASANAKKVYLYSNSDFSYHESPNAYGMCDSSVGVIHGGAEPTGQRIMEGIVAESFADPREFVPMPVLEYLSNLATSSGVTQFSYGSGSRIGRYLLLHEAVLTDGWSELETWGIWTIGFRAVFYLKIPSNNAMTAAFLELDISSPGQFVDVSIAVNGRRAKFHINGLEKITLELSQIEKHAGYHRVIFDIANPIKTPEGDRLIGIGLRWAKYAAERDPKGILWPVVAAASLPERWSMGEPVALKAT